MKAQSDDQFSLYYYYYPYIINTIPYTIDGTMHSILIYA